MIELAKLGRRTKMVKYIYRMTVYAIHKSIHIGVTVGPGHGPTATYGADAMDVQKNWVVLHSVCYVLMCHYVLHILVVRNFL